MTALLKRLWIALIREWRIHRDPIGYTRSIGVNVGEECNLINIKACTFGSEPWLVRLGNHVEVTSGVRFITHDGGMWVFRQQYPEVDLVAPIVVGDNVFIGTNAILLPGVTIGHNCVIAAGAVVSRDIPSNTVAGGVPAKPIKTIEEYWDTSQGKTFHIHNKSPEEKRNFLTRHFNR